MGYYKDRIKGSKLRPYLHKISFISTIASFVVGAVIFYGSPGLQRIQKLMEQGRFDESPERQRIREQMTFPAEFGMNLRTTAVIKKVHDNMEDVEVRDV